MPRKIIPYNPALKELATQLRNNSTQSEIFLWLKLKGKQMCGYDFHRQKPIGDYICDFFCHELMLAIELDGLSHEWEETREKDKIKESFLKSQGITVLRFKDHDVIRNENFVLGIIYDWIQDFEKQSKTHP